MLLIRLVISGSIGNGRPSGRSSGVVCPNVIVVFMLDVEMWLNILSIPSYVEILVTPSRSSRALSSSQISRKKSGCIWLSSSALRQALTKSSRLESILANLIRFIPFRIERESLSAFIGYSAISIILPI